MFALAFFYAVLTLMRDFYFYLMHNVFCNSFFVFVSFNSLSYVFLVSSVVKESSTAPSLTINSTYTFNENDPTAQRKINITTTVSSPTTTSIKSLHVTITGKTKIRLPNDSIVLLAEVDEKTLNGKILFSVY